MSLPYAKARVPAYERRYDEMRALGIDEIYGIRHRRLRVCATAMVRRQRGLSLGLSGGLHAMSLSRADELRISA